MFHVEQALIRSGLLFFTKISQNYHTDFTKRVYYIDNETKGVINIRPYKKSVIHTDGGYDQLWIAVIQQAVNDYRHCPQMRASVARFLKSKYFESMSGVSGQSILDRLKKEAKQNKR